MTQFSLTVTEEFAGQRLDVCLSECLESFSRSKLRLAITEGQVQVDGKTAKPSYRLVSGQKITARIELDPDPAPVAENVPLDILHEDDSIIVVNKPPGMVVHPAKGHWQGTLVSALVFHFGQLSTQGGKQRPGIVHRLDRDTSGVIVVAKTDAAHSSLSAQFENRTVGKEYLAVVSPPPDRDRDWIDQPIGPHPYQREKMAARTHHPQSRKASTFYEVIFRRNRFAAVRLEPKTGRTHQIRVHMQHIGCPIVADNLYAGHAKLLGSDLNVALPDDEPVIERQALHAHKLRIKHPISGDELEFLAPIPPDLQKLLDILKNLPPRS